MEGAELRDVVSAVERQRLRALVEPDLEAARALHADDYELITPGGAAMSRDGYLGAVASGELRYRVFEPVSDMSVRQLGDRAAAVRYRVRIEIYVGDELDTGDFWHTDIYELTDGSWRAVWSHATRIRRP